MNKLVVKKTDVSITASWTTEEIQLIKETVCKGASDNEFKLFLYQANKTGLDPLARQIYSIKRRERREDGSWADVRTIQTAIDGSRVVAERHGKYAGQVGPFWCGPDGVWQDVWVNAEPPAAARIGVLRSDFKETCWGVARFDAYAQKKDNRPIAMWAKMGDVMVAKCAEALALRKAFPQDLSGVYTHDEMQQAGPTEEIIEPAPAIEPPSKAAEALVDIASQEQEYSKPEQIADDIAASKVDWKAFGEKVLEAYRTGADLTPEQLAMLDRMEQEKPRSYQNLMKAAEKARSKPETPPQPKPEDDPDAYRVWLIDQMSRFDTAAGLNDFFAAQQKLWEPCFPPDIEDWDNLFKERAAELGK